jgi:hypothetical protein
VFSTKMRRTTNQNPWFCTIKLFTSVTNCEG